MPTTPENPNEYNDEAFSNISMSLAGDPGVADFISEFWNNGATRDDIVAEFEMTIDNVIADLAGDE